MFLMHLDYCNAVHKHQFQKGHLDHYLIRRFFGRLLFLDLLCSIPYNPLIWGYSHKFVDKFPNLDYFYKTENKNLNLDLGMGLLVLLLVVGLVVFLRLVRLVVMIVVLLS